MAQTILDGGGSAYEAKVDGDNRLWTNSVSHPGSSALGVISTENSSTSNLLANGSFVGNWEEVKNYSMIYVSARTDQDSANTGTFGFNLEFSHDAGSGGVDIMEEYFQASGATGGIYSTQPSSRFFRVNYINGPTDQGLFRLQTLFRPNYGKPSSHRIDEPIGDQNDAELNKSVLSAKGDDGIYTNITATSDNSLRVTNIAEGLSIAKGDVSNTTFIHKFGNAPDFDTGDNVVTIWDGADDADTDQMKYIYSTTNDIDSITSTDSSDTQEIEVQGLGVNYEPILQTATVAGSGYTALGSPLMRVFRMKNENTTDNAGHISVYVSGTTTAGIPDDTSGLRATIHPGNNQTLMALYTIPSGCTGYMRDWYASSAGANRLANYVIDVRARPLGGVFQLKHRSALEDGGTSYIKHNFIEPEVFSEKTDIEMRAQVVTAGISEASVSAGFDIVLINN